MYHSYFYLKQLYPLNLSSSITTRNYLLINPLPNSTPQKDIRMRDPLNNHNLDFVRFLLKNQLLSIGL
jgi:hypothetical protein